MEKVFITMHDLSDDAHVVYASDSISDVLGYAPHEVVGKSCFDYFHPSEVDSARKIHSRGIQLDKAAMLIYCKVRQKNGEYIYCECIFSVVYDVFVAAISVHSRSSKSEGRALTAPVIRRVFSSSPSDPRYHMLTHLSSKFRSPPPGSHEPRAALILNRFTRSLTILYASHALGDILDFPPGEAIGKSFYECISQHCLQDAVEALERAKENDSIAYLRFQWRDPRQLQVEERRRTATVQRQPRSRVTRSQRKRAREDDDDDGVEDVQREPKRSTGKRPATRAAVNEGASTSAAALAEPRDARQEIDEEDIVAHNDADTSDNQTSDASLGVIDVEAVVSCTSDGLVVIIRRARPLIPKPLHGSHKGVYASPWAPVPLGAPPSAQEARGDAAHMALLDTIKQVAVFAWSLRQLGGEAVAGKGGLSQGSMSKTQSDGSREKQSLLTESSSDSLSTGSRSTMATSPSCTTNHEANNTETHSTTTKQTPRTIGVDEDVTAAAVEAVQTEVDEGLKGTKPKA